MKFEQYLNEGRRKVIKYKPGKTLFLVRVKDIKKGHVISTVDSTKFMKIMEKEFRKFKFVQDAVDFYNKHYKRENLQAELILDI